MEDIEITAPSTWKDNTGRTFVLVDILPDFDQKPPLPPGHALVYNVATGALQKITWFDFQQYIQRKLFFQTARYERST